MPVAVAFVLLLFLLHNYLSTSIMPRWDHRILTTGFFTELLLEVAIEVLRIVNNFTRCSPNCWAL